MELIGINEDGSGLYRIYRDGDFLVTHTGGSENEMFELARQPLTAASEYSADSEDDWYRYGTDGHACDIHFEAPYARIDGVTFELGEDVGDESDAPISAAGLGFA